MVDFLVKILLPIVSKMGVSQADLTSYLTKLIGYIYVILIVTVLLIAVQIAAHWLAKKGKRHVIRISAGVAYVLVLVTVVNMICYGPMYANVSGVLNASPLELSDDVVANSKAVIKETGEEGLVLLKNDGLLPLAADTTSLNVFGWDSTNPLFGGVGSGSSDSASAVGVLESLEKAGYSTNEELSNMYTKYRADRPHMSMAEQDWTLPEPTQDYYTEELMSSAAGFSDTAVIVLGRSGGEGADLPTDMKAVIDGTYDVRTTGVIEASVSDNYNYTNAHYTNNGDYDDFDAGESYLELSNTEENMVDLVCSKFDKVIVVINASNSMELGWVENYDSIGAVILAPGTGATGMEALGEILNGTVNPSGKTVDTFVYDLTAAPTYHNIGNFAYTNADDLKSEIAQEDSAYEGNISFVDYAENIYVGYKFYETAAEEGVINYDKVVQYPFGYGLSYTTFSQEITDFKVKNDTAGITVKVTNTGDAAGKDVIQLYVTPPYQNGGIEKASVNLVDFQKTDLIEPSGTYEYTFEVALEDLASYDSACIKTENGGYILEAGEYHFSVRADSHTVLDEEVYALSEDIDYGQNGRESDKTAAVNVFTEYAKGDVTYLSRADGFKNYEEALAGPKASEYEMDSETKETVAKNTNAKYKGSDFDNEEDEMPVTEAENGLVLADMTGLSYDDEKWDDLLDELSAKEMVNLVNVGGWQTVEIDSIEKVATSDCDGPAGLSNFVTGNYGTAFPAEVLMAQTWSKEMAEKIGDAIGQEYANANNYGWYGPAMNTHRSAFSGRNFEYFSEDAVLAGHFASAEVNSAAKYGVYAYIKHFALNDQETNRCAVLLTYADEQCIREIYLKPFEMVVKNFDFEKNVLGVMSAYNWIGTTPAYANPQLLKTVLRDEWGFCGVVITDYNGSYGYQNTDAAIRNGGDLMLGYGTADSNKVKTKSATVVKALRNASKNILYVVANSGYYKDPSADQGGMSNMTKLFVIVDGLTVVLAVLVEAAVILRMRRKREAIAVVETTEENK